MLVMAAAESPHKPCHCSPALQERQAREQMRREARWEQEERHEREVRQDKLQEGRRR